MDQDKWDRRFLELARHISTWSRDPSTKVGAVLVKDKRIISTGFNGIPAGIKDTEERLNNRDVKIAMTLHAEDNAILFANESLKKATIYVWPFSPCSHCAARIIQKKIRRCVCPPTSKELMERWGVSIRIAEEMFQEKGIELVHLVD